LAKSRISHFSAARNTDVDFQNGLSPQSACHLKLFTLLGILAAIWIYLDVGEFFVSYGIYIAAAVYGGVNSIFLITRYI
jgi:hypothetical protein